MMESSLRQLRIVWGALITSIVLYAVIGERVAHTANAPNKILLEAIAAVCVMTIFIMFVLRRITVDKPAEILAARPDDMPALVRWRGGWIVTMALCEAIALYGFVLRMQNSTLAQAGTFYLAAGLLMVFYMPRRPSGMTV